MLFDILLLFASAGLGVAATECREWAQRKAGERNHDIDQALFKAHQRTLKEIRDYCQKSPEWDRYHRVIITRIEQITDDYQQILTIVEAGQSPGSEGSLQLPQQQDISQNLMQRLEKEHQWLREAPPVLGRNRMKSRMYSNPKSVVTFSSPLSRSGRGVGGEGLPQLI